jgi:hypothetical protein
MSDPRNVAHAKKVKQEKEHQQPAAGSDAKPKKKRKTEAQAAPESAPAEAPKVDQAAADHERSVAVLSKLKDMEFHSRANIETLAGLILTIEEKLKQKEFSDRIGEVYAAKDSFHTKIAALIESYEAKVESLKPAP